MYVHIIFKKICMYKYIYIYMYVCVYKYLFIFKMYFSGSVSGPFSICPAWLQEHLPVRFLSLCLHA